MHRGKIRHEIGYTPKTEIHTTSCIQTVCRKVNKANRTHTNQNTGQAVLTESQCKMKLISKSNQNKKSDTVTEAAHAILPRVLTKTASSSENTPVLILAGICSGLQRSKPCSSNYFTSLQRSKPSSSNYFTSLSISVNS